MFAEGFEEVHVPHLKPKPFDSNEVQSPRSFPPSVLVLSLSICVVTSI